MLSLDLWIVLQCIPVPKPARQAALKLAVRRGSTSLILLLKHNNFITITPLNTGKT